MKAHHDIKLVQKKARRISSKNTNNCVLAGTASPTVAPAAFPGAVAAPQALLGDVAFDAPRPPAFAPPQTFPSPAFAPRAQPPPLAFSTFSHPSPPPSPPQLPAYLVNMASAPPVVTAAQLCNIYEGSLSVNGIPSILQYINNQYNTVHVDNNNAAHFMENPGNETIPEPSRFSQAFDASASASAMDVYNTNHSENVSYYAHDDFSHRQFLAGIYTNENWYDVEPHGLHVPSYKFFTRRVVTNGIPEIRTYSQDDLVNHPSIVSNRPHFPNPTIFSGRPLSLPPLSWV